MHVVLEGLQSGRNIGACLRTIECFGIQNVHVVGNPRDSASAHSKAAARDYYINQKCSKQSGSWVSIHDGYGDCIKDCIEYLQKEKNCFVIATDLSGSKGPLDEIWNDNAFIPGRRAEEPFSAVDIAKALKSESGVPDCCGIIPSEDDLKSIVEKEAELLKYCGEWGEMNKRNTLTELISLRNYAAIACKVCKDEIENVSESIVEKFRKSVQVYESQSMNQPQNYCSSKTMNTTKPRHLQSLAIQPRADGRMISDVAIVFGNEVFGISDEARKAADLCAHFPMTGMTKSLNVSCAVAAALQHARSAGWMEGRLSLEDQLGLCASWTNARMDRLLGKGKAGVLGLGAAEDDFLEEEVFIGAPREKGG